MAYPILRKLGISIDVYYVNDPDECRKIFNKYDTINGKFIKTVKYFPRKNFEISDFKGK